MPPVTPYQMNVSDEEKVAQLEKVLEGRALHGSESLKAFLRFVVLKAVEKHETQLKEYVIATEVFGRSSDYNSRIDSVVRVQASRLRAKLQEYYATEGKDDKVIIELPKGHYTPVFSYADGTDGVNGAAIFPKPPPPEAAIDLPPGAPAVGPGRWWKAAAGGATVAALVLGLLAFNYRAETARLRSAAPTPGREVAERQAAESLWGDLLRSPEPFLVVFSNTLFQGTAEEGMKLLKSLDSPGSSLGSPAMPQDGGEAEVKGRKVTEHYTGIGEAMGIYFLGDFFSRVGHPFRVKRSLLLTWDDLKSENIVVLGSPAENLFLRDLPQKQDFVFRLIEEKEKKVYGVVNTKPRAGEEPYYLARQEGPSRSQITEDYAVVSRLRGLDAKNRLLILAGITTLATQSAAEYVTRPEYIKELTARLSTAPAGSSPELPPYFQVVVRVKVNGGVPVQISYVTHHALP